MLFFTEFQTVLAVTFKPDIRTSTMCYRAREPLFLCNMFRPIVATDNRKVLLQFLSARVVVYT